MHPALITLAAHLPAIAWAGAAPDSAIDALLRSGRPRVRITGKDGGAPETLDVGRMVTLLARRLRETTARPGDPANLAAAELIAALPVSPGDVSAAPAHAEISRAVTQARGGVLVRDPSDRSGLLATLIDDASTATWTIETCADVPMPPQPLSVASAGTQLTDAVHNAADIIAAAQSRHVNPPIAGTAGDDMPPFPAAPHLVLPPGMTNRELSLLDRADTIEAIRAMANAAEKQRGAVAQQQPLLWGLQSAVDSARRAALAAFAQRQLESAIFAGRVG